METDQHVLTRIHHELEVTGNRAELLCVIGIEAAMAACEGKSTLIVIDEADYCLLDAKKRIDQKVKAVVAFSATFPEDDVYEMITLK